MSKLQQYLDADKLIKENEKLKNEARPFVTKLLRRCKRLGIEVPGVLYIENTRFEFLEDELYNWVSSKVGEEVLEELTDIKKSINLERLQDAYLEGKINTLEMPETCYKKTTYTTIRTQGLKQ